MADHRFEQILDRIDEMKARKAQQEANRISKQQNELYQRNILRCDWAA